MTGGIRVQAERVRAELSSRPERLRRHVERVLVEALELALAWDVDPDRVELATWGHDLFRAASPDELVQMSRAAGVPIEAPDLAEPVLLHGPLAAAVLESRFAVSDVEVLAAVRDHTLGLAEMPLLAKIILVADKVESRKRQRTPVMKQIRRLARRDLDLALLCWADWKWVEERSHGWQSNPQHWHAREEWIRQHHLELALPRRSPETEDGSA
jgi:predicted HD superfamily hydrolase involved in NAD metabolism